MEKATSYYDWELQFRPKKKIQIKNRETNLNSLGIPRTEYKRFLDELKAKNLGP